MRGSTLAIDNTIRKTHLSPTVDFFDQLRYTCGTPMDASVMRAAYPRVDTNKALPINKKVKKETILVKASRARTGLDGKESSRKVQLPIEYTLVASNKHSPNDHISSQFQKCFHSKSN